MFWGVFFRKEEETGDDRSCWRQEEGGGGGGLLIAKRGDRWEKSLELKAPTGLSPPPAQLAPSPVPPLPGRYCSAVALTDWRSRMDLICLCISPLPVFHFLFLCSLLLLFSHACCLRSCLCVCLCSNEATPLNEVCFFDNESPCLHDS